MKSYSGRSMQNSQQDLNKPEEKTIEFICNCMELIRDGKRDLQDIIESYEGALEDIMEQVYFLLLMEDIFRKLKNESKKHSRSYIYERATALFKKVTSSCPK